MRVEHQFRVHGRCPVDNTMDVYDVTITARTLVKVEDILAAVGALKWPLYQEQMTTQLAGVLGCHVRSVGYHSGVKTTCEA